MSFGLTVCTNKACFRKIAIGVKYCCPACGAADGKFDPEGYHSETCDARLSARGQWTDEEAEIKRCFQDSKASLQK